MKTTTNKQAKKKLERLDVISFGEILWDVFEVAPGTFVRELGGAPANLAVTLARLGVRAAVVGGVGKDRFGDDLLQFLAQNDVDTRFVIRYANRTGLAFITRDERGEPSFLFYRHETADMAIRARDVTLAMGRARWMLIGTSTLVSPPLAAATRAFMQSARKSGANLVVDLNVRAHLWKSRSGMRTAIGRVLRDAMLIKASTTDLLALDVGKEAAALDWVRNRAKKATIVLTRGAGDATAIGAHGDATVPTRAVKCVDATGAGDAFTAGVLATLIAADVDPKSTTWRDAEIWKQALEVGHMLGAKAVSRRGAVSGITHLEKIHHRLSRMRKEK